MSKVGYAILLALMACWYSSSVQAATEQTSPEAMSTTSRVFRTPVVLELFTSQGCSSCPPADQLLSQLGQDGQFRDVVIPIAYHVEYWNRTGWRDPFSDQRWTARQEAYASTLQSHQVYTPQLVINGRLECVGSDATRVREEIANAQLTPPGGRVTLAVAPSQTEEHTLRVKVVAEVTRRLKAKELQVIVVLLQNHLTTNVTRGENHGQTLVNDFVVRRLTHVFSLPSQPFSPQEGLAVFERDPQWPLADLEVVAFLQDPSSMAIYGAASHSFAQHAQ